MLYGGPAVAAWIEHVVGRDECELDQVAEEVEGPLVVCVPLCLCAGASLRRSLRRCPRVDLDWNTPEIQWPIGCRKNGLVKWPLRSHPLPSPFWFRHQEES